jgi:hypothetical protein
MKNLVKNFKIESNYNVMFSDSDMELEYKMVIFKLEAQELDSEDFEHLKDDDVVIFVDFCNRYNEVYCMRVDEYLTD